MLRVWRALRARLRETLSPGRVERELDEEMRHHLERETEALIRRGLDTEEARRRAFASFGRLDAVREQVREEAGFHTLRHLRRELRHARRRLARDRGFTVAAVGTLALGIGATTAIFTVLHAVVLAPLPYPHADRLVRLWHSAPGADIAEIDVSYGTYVFYRELARSFDDLAIFHRLEVTVRTDGEAERVPAAIVTPGLFPLVFDGPPLLGRVLQEADGADGAPRVVLLGQRYWEARFGADPSVLGRTIDIGGTSAEVVGVLPRSFRYPTADTDLWYAIRLDPAEVRLGGFGAEGVARLAPGVTLEAARRELADLVSRLDERYPGGSFEAIVRRGRLTAHLEPLVDHIVGTQVRRLLWVIVGTVGVVLVIACANLANLVLVRMETRRRELAVRRALGAGWRELAGTFLGEPLLLAATGGVLGLGLSAVGIRMLLRLGARMLPRAESVGTDPSTFLFTAGVSLAASLAVGLVPLLLHREREVADALAAARRGTTSGRRVGRLRDGLAVAQLAFALLLLTGAALMARSFWNLSRTDPGFRATGALTFEVALSAEGYPDRESAARFQQRAIDRLGGLPGVSAVGAGDCVPLACFSNVNPLSRADLAPGPDEIPPAVQLHTVAPGYFHAAGIPVLEGRELERSDHERETGAALVNHTLAERFWPGRSPIGMRIYPSVADSVPWYHIVGVVGDTPLGSLTEPVEPTAYFPMVGPDRTLVPSGHLLRYIVRADRPVPTLVPEIRAAIRELDPSVPLTRFRPLRRVVDDASATHRFAMVLLAIAAAMATLLGGVGIYAVLSYQVGLRRSEIGIRMALGARTGEVRRSFLRRGAGVAGLGITLGLAGAVALTRVLGSLLYGVTATDPATFALVAVSLFLVALLACYLPARRASRVDPASTLKAG